jgi:NADPH2 dehydrogenase
MTSALFSPIRLAGLELANRVVVSPMCQYSANDGVASDWHITHLGMLANSGAGLVISEMANVERHGRISHQCLGLYSDACEDALAHVVAHCKRIGTAKIGVQIAHAGRKGSVNLPWVNRDARGAGAPDPWPIIAPSALPFSPGWATPRAMTAADIERIRDAFVASTERAVRIGFDAIELHAAHGYLLHSFQSPISNRRTDDYGGSHENRMRFPLEVAKACRAVVPRSIAFGARVTGTDWMEGGLTPDDSVVFAKALKAAGLDYLCVSSGGVGGDKRPTETAGYNVQFAEKVKREVGIPTRAVGMIATPQEAEAIVAEGRADMVAIGRAFLDDPHWCWHAAAALGAEVERPPQYRRAAPSMWSGTTHRP